MKDIEVESTSINISEETSNNILSMMESVVMEGTAKGAQVAGYRIGGKTGTSEDGVNTNKYVASFLGVASTKNPEIVLLITLYNPIGEGGHQGGGVAAPVGGQIFSEVLPYLEMQKTDLEKVEIVKQVSVPNIIGLSLKEAEKLLKEKGLEISTENQEEFGLIVKEENFVKTQIPSGGIVVNEGSKVLIEY